MDKKEGTNKQFPFGVFVIVFSHIAAFYKFAPFWDDYLYYINDDRFYDQKEWLDTENFFKIVIEYILEAEKLNKGILVLNFSPIAAVSVQAYIKKMSMDYPTKYICLSFFHDDIITSNIITDFSDNTSSNEYVMDAKFEILKSMTNFPFIKKIEIPFDFEITDQYLANIIHEQLIMSN